MLLQVEAHAGDLLDAGDGPRDAGTPRSGPGHRAILQACPQRLDAHGNVQQVPDLLECVWPAVLMHASHNAAITLAFSAVTADTGRTAWWIDEFGALLAVVSILMALAVSRWPRPAGE